MKNKIMHSRKYLIIAALVPVLAVLTACPAATPTPGTPQPAGSPTITRSPTPTITRSPTPTVTASPTRSPSPSPARTVSPIATLTPTVTPSPTGTLAPAGSPTPAELPGIQSLTVEVSRATSTPSPTVTPAATPTGATADVEVSIEVVNFGLVSKLGGTPMPGEGHLHFYLDTPVPTTAGQPATAAPGSFVVTEDNSYTWRNVTPGSHTFGVQFTNNDHTPLEPPVYAEVTIIVVVPSR